MEVPRLKLLIQEKIILEIGDMNLIPFNSRLLVEEIKESKEQKVGDIYIPEFTKERKDLPKFLRVKVLDVAPNLPDFQYLKGKEIIIETGFLEEIKLENKIHRFSLINYVVCVLDPTS